MFLCGESDGSVSDKIIELLRKMGLPNLKNGQA